MSMNNNNPSKSLGASSSPFANAGMVAPSMSGNPAFSQAQAQAQLSAGFQAQFQLSQAQFQLSQAQALALAQSKALAHARAQGQSVHAQFQAQLQAQSLALSQAQNAGIGNLGSSSPSMSTPGSASAKRIFQRPPMYPPAVPMTNTMSPLRTMELTAAARRKKQRIPDKQLQERVATILPESALYTQLLEFEARVDAAVARKKVDIQEALKNPPSVQKTLRIYVFNTFSNQIQTIPKKPNAEPPVWTLKIIGKILEDGVDPDQPGFVHKTNPQYPKFSSFFKRVTISLDQRLYPDNHIIIWEHARSPAPQEGFEVKRKGEKEFTVNIRLEMNYVPEKFKLSSALMEVLGIEVDTRPRILAAIWHYVKARKLQNPSDSSCFNCDAQLQKVFGEDRVKFTMVPQKILQHLSPPPPIHLEHKIKLSGNSPAGNACYDVLVDIPFPIQSELSALLTNGEKTKEIDACDESICATIRKIHDHCRRRAFFLGFSQSPVEFINALVQSQTRDLKLVTGEPSRSAEKERHSDFFNKQWVEDAVIRYLNRKPPAGSDAPGST
ncbi:SWI/SNF complex component SNF12-like protein [Hibiscus syriacus]|uniref:SWI/SNF complex component SNF12-like protein n=1 Tax=Hibiscus syriacus TaxID=106335 RepID=A0A6A3AP80_HIBSY|nr:SWI/SNF complex component SNF12 homolog [Hibiscus syriacus]XP_038999773.1 SWI/SNF complex component SNF12 homolog [Hibiscus syriacus]KAE8705055.1 SWI/SNF complex component SNF12-like protein [Hibiscus syriacus]